MQIQISLASVWRETTITGKGAGTYLTLTSNPPKEFTFKALMKVPYVKVIMDFVWDKNSEYEQVLPTLDYLSVPPKLRDNGLASQLLNATLSYMRQHDVPYLIFDNYEKDFWAVIAKRMKANVQWTAKHKKRIGFFTLPKVDVSNII